MGCRWVVHGWVVGNEGEMKGGMGWNGLKWNGEGRKGERCRERGYRLHKQGWMDLDPDLDSTHH